MRIPRWNSYLQNGKSRFRKKWLSNWYYNVESHCLQMRKSPHVDNDVYNDVDIQYDYDGCEDHKRYDHDSEQAKTHWSQYYPRWGHRPSKKWFKTWILEQDYKLTTSEDAKLSGINMSTPEDGATSDASINETFEAFDILDTLKPNIHPHAQPVPKAMVLNIKWESDGFVDYFRSCMVTGKNYQIFVNPILKLMHQSHHSQ